MSAQDLEEAKAVLEGLRKFGKIDAVARLAGLTNRVYRAWSEEGPLCLRIPGKGTEEYINRAHEGIAAQEASRAGISPELLYFDGPSGIMVTRFLPNVTTMTPQGFRDIKGAPARAGEAFRKLHASGAAFANRFELFEMIDGYLKILATKDVELPEGYHDVVKEAESVRRALAAHQLPLVSCHCDPLSENFLDNGTRMWIVDWEYSGMNDPLWDLGDLSVEAGFGHEQDEEMIRAYFGGEAKAHERGRIVIYKAMCDLLWTLWGLIQLANKNPADDFSVYAATRFARCKALMNTQDFPLHTAAVAGLRD
jgi:thiamine kinase-like enzyme